MCTCIQKSRVPAGALGNFNYIFTCTQDDGTTKDFKVTEANDNAAKLQAEIECELSKSFAVVKAIRHFDSRGNFFTGFNHPDMNIPGHEILVRSRDKVYSFHKDDILSKTKLPNDMTSVEVRNGAVGYLSTAFKVGAEELSFLDITDKVEAPLTAPKLTDPRHANQVDIDAVAMTHPPAKSLASVAAHWTVRPLTTTKPHGGCSLGLTPGENNCAHYLSDAFIGAGYTELIRKNSEGKGIFGVWCDTVTPPGKYNENARPIRAVQMKAWFDSKAIRRETTIQSGNGFWAVYQQDPSSALGHVLLYDSNNRIAYGTGDGGYWDWDEQSFYQW
jgi:hypothetical protein